MAQTAEVLLILALSSLLQTNVHCSDGKMAKSFAFAAIISLCNFYCSLREDSTGKGNDATATDQI